MDAPIVVLERDPGYLREVWAWFGIGVLIIALRFAVRIRMVGFKGFEGDDYVTFLVLGCYTMDAVFVTECYWLGTNVDVDPRNVNELTDAQVSRLSKGSKFEIGAWYSYTFLIWCMKATVLFFYNRITFGLNQHRIVKWLAVFCAACYIAVFLTITFACNPTAMNWQVRPLPPRECTIKEQNFIVTAILNVITDGAILAVPVPLLWKLRVPLHKKIVIALLLSSGLFIISAAIIRATATLSSTPSSITMNRWGVRETIVGILSINIPILRPLFHRGFWTPGPVIQPTQSSCGAHGHKKSGYARGPSFELKSDISSSVRPPSPSLLRNTSDDSAIACGISMPENGSQEHIMHKSTSMTRECERMGITGLEFDHEEDEACREQQQQQQQHCRRDSNHTNNTLSSPITPTPSSPSSAASSTSSSSSSSSSSDNDPTNIDCDCDCEYEYNNTSNDEIVVFIRRSYDVSSSRADEEASIGDEPGQPGHQTSPLGWNHSSVSTTPPQPPQPPQPPPSALTK